MIDFLLPMLWIVIGFSAGYIVASRQYRHELESLLKKEV